MCGRFTLSQDPDVYATYFGADAVRTEALAPSYNVAPTDPVYAVAEHDGERLLGSFRWGLIPWFAKDRKVAARNINARVETAAEKPTFRDAFAKRRCLIPADGFYEWEKLGEGKGKLPHYIYATDRTPLAFAGLWGSWRDPETEARIRTCTILTGSPDPLVRPIHDRMPVILPARTWDDWLDRETQDVARISALLRDAEGPSLAEHPVSSLVNSVKNNLPDLIEPLRVEPGGQLPFGP